MPNKMLIDASHPEETRVVVVRGNRIEEFDFESQDKKQLKGNIYLARVTRVEPSLQAAFVEYGGNRHGFLAFSEIHPDYYQIPVADRQALLKAEAEAASDDDDDEDEERRDRGRGRRRRRGRNRDQERRGGELQASDDASEQAEAEESHDEDDFSPAESMTEMAEAVSACEADGEVSAEDPGSEDAAPSDAEASAGEVTADESSEEAAESSDDEGGDDEKC